MNIAKFACAFAAVSIGLGVAATSTNAFAKAPIVVVAPDPELQRRVSYADLNLALRPHQKVLTGRIYRTAGNLCFDLNGDYGWSDCRTDAVRSTDTQVAAAIERAQRQMAGLPVGPAVAISMVINGQ